ncbi:MAG TPA: FliH/SctL family protein [Lacipirellulaceae bacterium]|nr:FliH/SctL family protein [Lacipirellulaceae bacterium]
MATIIKHETFERASGMSLRQVAYDLTDMAAEADDYLGGVRREAAKIVEQARREAATVRQEAEAAGRRAAEEAIERVLDEKVARQMKTLTPALQAAAEQIREAKHDWLRQWETSAIGLAAAMAARLVRGELAARPEISVAWLREALELVAGAGEIAIHLSTADYTALERHAAALAAAMHPTATVRLVSDPSITPGGCRVATNFGSVDMQLESQLHRMTEELS